VVGGWNRVRLSLVLLMGVTACSFGAIFIRVADAPPLVIVAGRLVLAASIVAPVGVVRCWPELRALERRDLLWATLSGLFLTLHFVFWIASLQHTTVASAVVFVSASPLFVAIASHLFTQDKLSRLMLVGVFLAVLGAMVIGWDDFDLARTALWGDFLAVLGAAMAAAYFMVGRGLRPKISLLAYVTVVYSIGAVGGLLLAGLTGQSLTGYSTNTYVMILLLAVGPQLIGHSSLNWALRHISATAIAVATLGEPVGSTILACLILMETPSLVKVGGGALILLGVYLSMREEERTQRAAVEP
jgi:drug/metabolite transporter (DMT)-like permease